jgi:hypothetical protein
MAPPPKQGKHHSSLVGRLTGAAVVPGQQPGQCGSVLSFSQLRAQDGVLGFEEIHAGLGSGSFPSGCGSRTTEEQAADHDGSSGASSRTLVGCAKWLLTAEASMV